MLTEDQILDTDEDTPERAPMSVKDVVVTATTLYLGWKVVGDAYKLIQRYRNRKPEEVVETDPES